MFKRVLSSGVERLSYKQRVGGSKPSGRTRQENTMDSYRQRISSHERGETQLESVSAFEAEF